MNRRVRQTARKSTGGVPWPQLATRARRIFPPEYPPEFREVPGANAIPSPPPPILDPIPPEQLLADRSIAREVMRNLNGWTEVEPGGDTFSREYIFTDFNEGVQQNVVECTMSMKKNYFTKTMLGINVAWTFMSEVARRLQLMNHHPDWRHINNTVTVTLPSPFSDGLSTKDSNTALFMDYLARILNP